MLAKQILTAAFEELEMKDITDVSSKRPRLDQQTQEDPNVAAKRKSLLWKYCGYCDELVVENPEAESSPEST